MNKEPFTQKELDVFLAELTVLSEKHNLYI